jgi:hypothetical protein
VILSSLFMSSSRSIASRPSISGSIPWLILFIASKSKVRYFYRLLQRAIDLTLKTSEYFITIQNTLVA